MYRIHRVDQPEQHRAIRRFWYRVYCEERGVLRHKADAAIRELDDPMAHTGNLFAATDDAGEVIGTVMSSYARDTPLGSYADFYELDRLLALQDGVAVVTKLMTAAHQRGTGLAIALLQTVTRQGLEDGITHALYDANPPTDVLFRRMGGVDWLGMKHHHEFGHVRVMMTRLRDDAARLSSPGHPLSDCYRDLPHPA